MDRFMRVSHTLCIGSKLNDFKTAPDELQWYYYFSNNNKMRTTLTTAKMFVSVSPHWTSFIQKAKKKIIVYFKN